jgi:hypothetical protein
METISWKADAVKIYNEGFVNLVRKAPGGGVCLWDREVIENDGPGAGTSEKGVSRDTIWGPHRARKVLRVDEPRGRIASLYVHSTSRSTLPLTFTVNGHSSRIEVLQRKDYQTVRWVEFPAEWLKKGDNVIELSCPEAKAEKEGWSILLARADEYEAGGGDPKNVGKTSFKSANNGESWKESPFGPLGQDRAEFCVRINIERHSRSGWLASPVIDLWRGDRDLPIARARTIQKLRLAVNSEVPAGTTLQCFIRKGTSPSPYSENWEPYELIGSGPSIRAEVEGARFNRRFLQFKLELSTTNPLASPVVKSAEISADFLESFPVPLHRNNFLVESYNPPVKYPSVEWEWEKWDRPEFTRLRAQENLDELVKGCSTQLDAQMKLLDYASKRWRWTSPDAEYPEWDALSIVDRVNKRGGGGMCIQENLFLVGMCQSYGWQGRLIGVDGHEVGEIWNDDYGKWIYFDAFFPNHILCDPQTGEPLSFLEIHNRYMDYFYPDRIMNWETDYRVGAATFKDRKDKPPVLRSSLTYHENERNAYTGFMESRVMRMVPRNNFYEKPFPRPLAHGSSTWPWNGYVTWYDEKTPPMVQYSRYTDRPRDLWPDLNTVHINVTQGYGNEHLFLEFETYTPNFSHFEVNTDRAGWMKTEERWTWYLRPGRNEVEVRAVSKLGVGGKPSRLVVNHVAMPLNEWEVK